MAPDLAEPWKVMETPAEPGHHAGTVSIATDRPYGTGRLYRAADLGEGFGSLLVCWVPPTEAVRQGYVEMATRIVTCVNACAGLTNEAVTAHLEGREG